MDVTVDELRRVESLQNDGRGVSCVRSILAYIDRGDIQSARAVANTDHDKIRSYNDLESMVAKVLWPLGNAPSWWNRASGGIGIRTGFRFRRRKA